MARMKSDDWCGCPIRFAAGVFGDKWSLLLLRDVLLHGRRRYSEFLGAGEGIATNVLASRLAMLEGEGLVDKVADPDAPGRHVYRPTEKARDLIPMLLTMVVWSHKWDARSGVSDKLAGDIVDDPETVGSRLAAAAR